MVQRRTVRVRAPAVRNRCWECLSSCFPSLCPRFINGCTPDKVSKNAVSTNATAWLPFLSFAPDAMSRSIVQLSHLVQVFLLHVNVVDLIITAKLLLISRRRTCRLLVVHPFPLLFRPNTMLGSDIRIRLGVPIPA